MNIVFIASGLGACYFCAEISGLDQAHLSAQQKDFDLLSSFLLSITNVQSIANDYWHSSYAYMIHSVGPYFFFLVCFEKGIWSLRRRQCCMLNCVNVADMMPYKML